MSTTFRLYAPDQSLLLPPDVREWLPEALTVACARRIASKARNTGLPVATGGRLELAAT